MKRAANKGRRSGFTLLEMLVVIAIIAILAGLLLPVLSQVKRHAKKTKARELMYQVRVAFKQYLVDYRKFPPVVISRTDTNTLKILSGTTHKSLGHKYMDVTTNEAVVGFLDPWNEQYWITVDNGLRDASGGDSTQPYDNRVSARPSETIQEEVVLWSTGEDKKDGTAAERKDDVRSWQ